MEVLETCNFGPQVIPRMVQIVAGKVGEIINALCVNITQVNANVPSVVAVVVAVVKSECPQGSQPLARIADTIADTHIPTAAPTIAAKPIVDMSGFVVPSRTLTVVPKGLQPCSEHNVVPPEAPNVGRELFCNVPVLARARNKSSERDVQEG